MDVDAARAEIEAHRAHDAAVSRDLLDHYAEALDALVALQAENEELRDEAKIMRKGLADGNQGWRLQAEAAEQEAARLQAEMQKQADAATVLTDRLTDAEQENARLRERVAMLEAWAHGTHPLPAENTRLRERVAELTEALRETTAALIDKGEFVIAEIPKRVLVDSEEG